MDLFFALKLNISNAVVLLLSSQPVRLEHIYIGQTLYVGLHTHSLVIALSMILFQSHRDNKNNRRYIFLSQHGKRWAINIS